MLVKPTSTMQFENQALDVYDIGGNRWLTLGQIGTALGTDRSALQKLYKRNAKEFGYDMSGIISVATGTRGSQQTRVFSARAAALLAMWTRSDRAAAFRVWVLDVLEGKAEVAPEPKPVLAHVHERLAGVVVERLPWQTFIDRYDRPGTLFYLDPPYHGCEGDYGPNVFDRDQFALIAQRLGNLKGGRFIMSINDHPDIRQLFAAFDIEEVPTTYTIGGNGNAKPITELVISG